MPGFTVGKQGRQARHPRLEHHARCIFDDVRGARRERARARWAPGYKIAIETLNEGRIGIGAQMIGVAQGALDAAVAHLKERKQFGKALAEFQGIQFQVAQAATELEAARLMVYNAARLKDAGHDIARQGAMAKLYASQMCERVTSLCRRAVRRLRLHARVSGGEVLPRREDRHDLRGHEQHAAADDRQGGPAVAASSQRSDNPMAFIGG